MDILALILITLVIAGGGLWIVTRDSPPANNQSEKGIR